MRALACPAVATLTVCEGACRGAGDLRTPVMVGLFAGVLNAFLDPLLMFPGKLRAHMFEVHQHIVLYNSSLVRQICLSCNT